MLPRSALALLVALAALALRGAAAPEIARADAGTHCVAARAADRDVVGCLYRDGPRFGTLPVVSADVAAERFAAFALSDEPAVCARVAFGADDAVLAFCWYDAAFSVDRDVPSRADIDPAALALLGPETLAPLDDASGGPDPMALAGLPAPFATPDDALSLDAP